ncbi:MAG: DUF1569 domain-containing protein [Acidobacteria bacterium]|jgi:hypothetical protein|nr:DUF1569 domain-containing protein [Acidobacteriota bacterium]
MPTLWNDAERQALVTRLRQVTPDAQPGWGSLTARGVLAHLHDAARMALGELDVASKKLPIRFPPLKQLIIYVVPFPKGAPTAPELIARQADDWTAEMAATEQAIDRLVAKGASFRWPNHPAFGSLTHNAWGVLIYRHMDHHLKQFGH